MKILNKICQILAIALALGSLVLFFMHCVTIGTNAGDANLAGAVSAFGGKTTLAGVEYRVAKSEYLLLGFLITLLGLVFSVSTFKYKKPRFFAPAAGIISAVLLLLIYRSPANFIDTRALPAVSVHVTKYVLFASIALFVYTAVSIAYLLIDDHLEVVASKGQKLSIPRRIIRFFRDYKSEIKKIVWPGPKDVLKNTVIVLLMCLIVGALIWLIDYGLGQLLTRILGS